MFKVVNLDKLANLLKLANKVVNKVISLVNKVTKVANKVANKLVSLDKLDNLVKIQPQIQHRLTKERVRLTNHLQLISHLQPTNHLQRRPTTASTNVELASVRDTIASRTRSRRIATSAPRSREQWTIQAKCRPPSSAYSNLPDSETSKLQWNSTREKCPQ